MTVLMKVSIPSLLEDVLGQLRSSQMQGFAEVGASSFSLAVCISTNDFSGLVLVVPCVTGGQMVIIPNGMQRNIEEATKRRSNKLKEQSNR